VKLAIVGPAGSGKSTFTKWLEDCIPYDAISCEDIYFFNCDEWIQSIYDACANMRYDPIIVYLTKVCPQCMKHKFPLTKIDKEILGTFLTNHLKERKHLEDLLFQDIKTYIESCENIVVDGLLPRFLKKIKFDYILYVHTDKKERVKRLKNRGVSSKRIKEIASMQKDMFKDIGK